jgi:hypothetical protein
VLQVQRTQTFGEQEFWGLLSGAGFQKPKQLLQAQENKAWREQDFWAC